MSNNQCNLVVLGDHNVGKSSFIKSLMGLEDQVLSNWWAKKIDHLKVNIWESNQIDRNLFWNKAQTIILVVNLSDPQNIESLSKLNQKIKVNLLTDKSIIVLGTYINQSNLTESLKIKMLEWLSSNTGDWPFIEVDLKGSNLVDTWLTILNHVS